MENYKALVVHEVERGVYERYVEDRKIEDLPTGDLLVRVHYSSLNYKDALSASGNRGVTRRYPHTPGIDAAGIVEESNSPDFMPGDEVIVNGPELGTRTPGGFGQYVRVPTDWVVKLPESFSLRTAMIYGVGGFTAAYSMLKLQPLVKPDQGPILVTGATGGVGCMAVAMLKIEGYTVAAVTGKPDDPLLKDLGVDDIIPRDEFQNSSWAMEPVRWPGVIDTVGGDILAMAIKTTMPNGVVTCCGNVASGDLNLTVYPFILRGVSLLGIDCVSCPIPTRQEIWKKLAGPWKLENLEKLATEVTLDQLSEKIDHMLNGQIAGRVIINLQND
ncbi:MAG: YhdH/YhfP family quinone oxidoreductase [Planctomycetota bacterium]|jgi:putative YhdH/YhfP family quinone oxidoreductase